MDHQLFEEYNQIHYHGQDADGIDPELKVLYQITNQQPELNIDSDQAWEQVSGQLLSPTIERSITTRRWLQIAAVLIIGTFMGLASFFYIGQTEVEAQMVSIENPTNKVKTHLLPDGSQVWLRKGAVLTYDEAFGSRTVTFQGEGYFAVEKGKGRFEVTTRDGLEIAVLGTEFGVNTTTSNTMVRVTEGTVSLSSKNSRQEIVAGETGIYYRAKQKVLKSTEDATNALAWKTGHFKFDNMPLPEAIRLLQSYYPTKVLLEDKALNNCTVNGEFQSQSLSDILEDLSLVLSINVQANGNSFLLSGEGC